MIGALTNLPDWATGASIAALGWFGVCYAELAPRVLEADIKQDAIPKCVQMIEAEQDRELDRARQDLTRQREVRLEQLQNEVRRAASRLREMESTLAQWRAYQNMMHGSGLGGLFQMPDMGAALPTEADIEAARSQVAAAREALANVPDIELPRMPSAEIAETCTCAALQTLSGERKNYAISLASFRLISPGDVSAAQNQMSQIVRWNGCGEKPWRHL